MSLIVCDARWLRAIATTVFFGAFVPCPALNAQGLEDKAAVDKIIGSDIQQEETEAAADESKVIAAIEKTGENIGTVRKTSKLDKIDIVFLTDAARSEGGPPPEIESKVKEHESEIAELRQEIEANALLFHAVDSHRVMTQDVLAVAFDRPGAVVIYAAAKPQD